MLRKNEKKNILYFLGPTGSGKTTSLEKIIQELSRKNITIGTIKFIHHPTMTLDPAGKDSSRHRKSGALFTLNFAPQETAIIVSKKKRETIVDAERILTESTGILPDVDVIFCESLNEPPEKSHVFISANNRKDVDQYIESLDNCEVMAIIGTIANKKEHNEKINEYRNIPILSALDQQELKVLVQKVAKLIENES